MYTLKINDQKHVFNSITEVKEYLSKLIQEDFMNFINMEIILYYDSKCIRVREHLLAKHKGSCCNKTSYSLGFNQSQLKGHNIYDMAYDFKKNMNHYTLIFEDVEFPDDPPKEVVDKPKEAEIDYGISFEDL